MALGAAALSLLAWNVAAAQPALVRGVQIAVGEDDQDLHVFDVGAARVLRVLVPPERFLLTDHPYIAYLARRMVPPDLVDPSRGRKRAGTLTDEVATQAIAERDVQVVMFWADRLRRLGRFDGWVRQRYRPVASFGTRIGGSRFGKDRTVYLRNDADFTAARTSLMGLLERPLGVEFADDVRLLGVTVEPTIVAPGEPFAITLGWEAVRDVKTEYNVILTLVGPDGRQYAAQEQDLEGIGAGGRDWRSGEWLLRAYMLVPRAPAPPGEYRVVLGLDSPRARRPAPLSANRDGLSTPSTEAPDRVVLGTVQIL